MITKNRTHVKIKSVGNDVTKCSTKDSKGYFQCSNYNSFDKIDYDFSILPMNALRLLCG